TVDRKVAPADVLFEAAVAHLARTAAVEIRPVVAERRHLERIAFVKHQNDAELRADLERARKEFPNLLGPRCGRDGGVVGVLAEHHVAQGTAGEIGLATGVAQATDHGNGFFPVRHDTVSGTAERKIGTVKARGAFTERSCESWR